MSITPTSLARELFVDPWKRLKYGFLPVRRIVDEDEATAANSQGGLSNDELQATQDYQEHQEHQEYEVRQKQQEKQAADNVEEEEVSNEETEFEYRDEANRPWWKFFDESEYRSNKKQKESNRWYSWFNGSPSAQEKKLILKLDVLLAFYSCMAYWVKYLDTVNLTNAYVSGMKEELGMKGNDLIHTQNMYSIGNIIFQLPFLFFLNKIPLNYLLPSLDLAWSLLTVGEGYVKTTGGIKALRFFVGAFEAPSYLAYQYLFGCFYKHDEMVRRSAFYYFGQYIGTLSSGGIQSAVYASLNGRNGLAGWRWNFIIDAIISVGVGLIGFYSLPGDPYNCYSIFLTDDEIRLARKRIEQNNTQGNDFHKKAFSFDVWKRVLFDWKVWVLSVWNIFCWCNSNAGTGCFILWLKSLKRYTIPKVNQLSMITPGLGLVYLTVTAIIADKFHSRWFAIIFTQVFNIIGNVILAVWYVEEGAKWFGFILQYMGWAMAPVLYGWMNDICRRDSDARAITLVIMNIAGSVFSVWTSVVFFPTVQAPRYLRGYSFTAACALALSIWTLFVLWLYKKDERKHSKDNGIILYNSSVETPPPGFISVSPVDMDAKESSQSPEPMLQEDYIYVMDDHKSSDK
ncbi:(ZYRO0E08228g) [Zygosaccharomyces parabailii]|uniref:BN860_04368g1_1 n=1 Tax=Zygosaccharomyces bailii (strain CLIB 213 / ATCC 58445 / CBS 680 / BCRC 21525 / NBRC 1098 / NCYC 1416 / NRRL Y-2227) TaxID=1333698 RepID=A0A8J2X645_ZYGB2|nr:(ZYRO0E08228g) [Zygosaccharomyces parabailii]CDF88191.1 BN860_04368g1_1 [Zygosaccharomyces bailii CLIB 213]CDH14911.1 probable transporter SEO1 [Zygosaccharomyces bailii ISA1307]